MFYIKNKKIYFRMQSCLVPILRKRSHHSTEDVTLEGFSRHSNEVPCKSKHKSKRKLKYKLKRQKTMPTRIASGSVTIEGAIAIPICLFVFAAILCFFNLLGGQTKEYVEANRLSQQQAVYACLASDESLSDIKTYFEYSDKVALLPDSIKNYFFYGEIVRKPWTGRSLNDASNDDSEEYVYVAENGSVYHVTENCTHLKLTINEVPLETIGDIRNQYGDKYTKCEYCGDLCGSIVYVGVEGDRYHSNRNCRGLKRSYTKVKKSECSLPACSRCSESEN